MANFPAEFWPAGQAEAPTRTTKLVITMYLTIHSPPDEDSERALSLPAVPFISINRVRGQFFVDFFSSESIFLTISETRRPAYRADRENTPICGNLSKEVLSPGF